MAVARNRKQSERFRARGPSKTGLLDGAGPREVVARIDSDADIVVARERARALAGTLGFSATDRVLIAAAISELARNILKYAGRGEIRMGAVYNHTTSGIGVEARDDGPGIDNLEFALKDGFSTSGGLGLGLPGVRRLMDDFEIETRVGAGTAVRATKWLKDGMA
jgi:serine/threonine-protein kinase RsbT